MAKKLSMKKVYESTEQYDHKEKIEFDDDTYVNLFPFISPQNVSRILETMAQDLTKYAELGIELEDRLLDDLIGYEILKVQSDITTPRTETNEGVKKDVQFFKAFINSPYYLEIMKYFDEEEIEKVYNKMYDSLEQFGKMENLMRKKMEEIQNLDLQSPELRERIFGVENKTQEH
jgi:hypothetical protein